MMIGYTSLQHPRQYLLGDEPIAASYAPNNRGHHCYVETLFHRLQQNPSGGFDGIGSPCGKGP